MTDEEIRAEAETRTKKNTEIHRVYKSGFFVGAKWHREQSDAKLKELRDEYKSKREHMDSFGVNNALLLGRHEAYGLFIDKLNAIIEKP